MNPRIAASLLLVAPLTFGGAFTGAVLSDDHTNLEIKAADGSRLSAPTIQDQVEFDKPLASPDGRYVGWLALFSNCCTSYSVPMTLVVLDEGRHLHTFSGNGQPVFKWCFLPDSRSVAYMQTVLHGTNYEHFERRTIEDGRLLAQYDYPNDEASNALARKKAPAWVRCVPE